MFWLWIGLAVVVGIVIGAFALTAYAAWQMFTHS